MGTRQATANPLEREESSMGKRMKEAADRPGTMVDGDTEPCWVRGGHGTTSRMAGTGQGAMAQRETRQKQDRELAGKQNGEMQGSLMEEICPTNSSKECSPPACCITLCTWTT